jgi:hypothetical protein
MLGRALALMAAFGRKDAGFEIPEGCATCAFREGCMTNMTAGTLKIALDCVLGIDPDRFACHHGMKEGEPTKLCTGYVAAILAPFSLVKEVMTAINADMKAMGDGPDEVRAEFDAWLAKADPEGKIDDVYQLARMYERHRAQTPSPSPQTEG